MKTKTPARHPECGISCLGPHPDYCQGMSDCWLKGQSLVAPKPRVFRTHAAKNARIRELEAEVERLKDELKHATEPRRTPDGGIQFPFGPKTGPLTRARKIDPWERSS